MKETLIRNGWTPWKLKTRMIGCLAGIREAKKNPNTFKTYQLIYVNLYRQYKSWRKLLMENPWFFGNNRQTVCRIKYKMNPILFILKGSPVEIQPSMKGPRRKITLDSDLGATKWWGSSLGEAILETEIGLVKVETGKGYLVGIKAWLSENNRQNFVKWTQKKFKTWTRAIKLNTWKKLWQ